MKQHQSIFRQYVRLTSFVLIISVIPNFFLFAQKPSHPFLIVTEDQYQYFQDKAALSPWKEIKRVAGLKADSLIYKSGDSWVNMIAVLNACALTYIVDPVKRPQCKNKIVATINQWHRDVSRIQIKQWDNSVPSGAAFFLSVIAMDIIYNDCKEDERDSAEVALERVYQLYGETDSYWPLNHWAVRMIGALYMADTVVARHAANQYYNTLSRYICNDGTWTQSPGYSWNRLGGSDIRSAKTYAMDVLEFTGFDKRYYSNQRFTEMFRWFFTFALNPFGAFTVFGDTGRFKPNNGGYFTRLFSVHKFSPLLVPYAQWFQGDAKPEYAENSLFIYLLAENKEYEERYPQSTLFRSSGAAFWQRGRSAQSLMAALWSASSQGKHYHKDINSISVAGFGQHLITNCGVSYHPLFADQTPDGDSWDESFLHNVVQINGRNHGSSVGGGLVNGIIGHTVEYARTSSAHALDGGIHYRTLVFNHPVASKTQGYFVLIDEVQNTEPGDQFSVILHPNTRNNPEVVQEKSEYTFTINAMVHNDRTDIKKITLFYGTEPVDVSVKQGWFGTWQETPVKGKYIESNYYTDSTGSGSAQTLLFPHDTLHEKAVMNRINGNGYHGVTVSQNTVTDYVIMTDSSETIRYNTVSFYGKSILLRQEHDTTVYYCVLGGEKFFDGVQGFSAEEEVDLIVENKKGTIISPGTSVTFYYPDITGVAISGTRTMKRSADDTVSVPVEKGSHRVEIFTNSNTSVKTQPLPGTPVTFFVRHRRALVLKSGAMQSATLKLYSLSGKLLYEKTCNYLHNSISIPLTFHGLYIVVIHSATGNICKKVMLY